VGWKSHWHFQHHVFLGDMSIDGIHLVDCLEGEYVGEDERGYDYSCFRPASVAKVGLSGRGGTHMVLNHNLPCFLLRLGSPALADASDPRMT
jgi:hypothetical protein